MRLAWVVAPLVSCLLAGCQRTTAAPDPAPALPECTLATPLVPGVPGSPGHLIPSAINPNGASELAVLMRGMIVDLERVRASLAQSSTVTAPADLRARHHHLRCAWPTDLADRNAQFDAFAQAYLTQVEALDRAAKAERRAAYDAVITACTSCHQQSCSGPIPRIEKLRL